MIWLPTRRRPVVGLSVLLAGVALASTGCDEPTRRPLAFATNSVGTFHHSAATVIASVLDARVAAPIRVQPQAGSNAVIDLVNSGEAVLGIVNTNDARLAHQGIEPFRAAPNVRTLTVLLPLRVGMFVRGDSDVRRVSDLRGRRVASRFTAQLAIQNNTTAILAGAGLTWEDVQGVPVTNVGKGTDALMEGRVDATLFALGSAKVREANAALEGGIRFLPIETSETAVARMHEAMPSSYPILVERGSTVGIVEDTWVLAYDILIITGAGVDPAVVSALTEALYESEAAVRGGGFAPLADFSREAMVKDNVTVPYHPGAVEAFEALGRWSDGMDDIQSQLSGVPSS